jgi:hypothetical protein
MPVPESEERTTTPARELCESIDDRDLDLERLPDRVVAKSLPDLAGFSVEASDGHIGDKARRLRGSQGPLG